MRLKPTQQKALNNFRKFSHNFHFQTNQLPYCFVYRHTKSPPNNRLMSTVKMNCGKSARNYSIQSKTFGSTKVCVFLAFDSKVIEKMKLTFVFHIEYIRFAENHREWHNYANPS